MLGGGNPVSSSNPAGTGSSFNYLGKHAYAFSGVVTDNTSGSAATTVLKFSTQNTYVVGKLTLINDEQGGATIFVDAFLNNEKIIKIITDVSSAANPFIQNPLHILIEPNSTFELKVGANAEVDFSAVFVGDAYA